VVAEPVITEDTREQDEPVAETANTIIKTGSAANALEDIPLQTAAPPSLTAPPKEEPATMTETTAPEPPKESLPVAPAVEFKDTLTVDELYDIFEADRAAATEEYRNKIIKLSGIFYRMMSNDQLEIAYAILTSRRHYGEQQVSCTFDKKHEADLNQLAVDSSVTIQGVFGGYGARILLRDCTIVR
jgi:hypothetical protein